MTLTVCLQGKDGIVIGSDSRGTFGDVRGVTAQNDTIKKTYLVGEVGILTAGAQNGNLIVEELAKAVAAEKIQGVTKTMERLRQISIMRFDEWFPGFPYFAPQGQNAAFQKPTVQLTVAGYDSEEGKPVPRLYSMVSNFAFSPNLHDFGSALGGVAQYALYLLNRLHSPDMGVASLKHLAAYVITETATQDGKVGGPVQLGIILPQGGAYILTKEQVDVILQENEKSSKGLKSLFNKEG